MALVDKISGVQTGGEKQRLACSRSARPLRARWGDRGKRKRTKSHGARSPAAAQAMVSVRSPTLETPPVCVKEAPPAAAPAFQKRQGPQGVLGESMSATTPNPQIVYHRGGPLNSGPRGPRPRLESRSPAGTVFCRDEELEQSLFCHQGIFSFIPSEGGGTRQTARGIIHDLGR